MQTEPKQFWQDILAMTAKLAGTAESLRIPLFMGLHDPRKTGLIKEIYRLVTTVRSFLRAGRSTLPDVKSGQLMFFFAHVTPSNMRNLLPVAREANRKGLLGGIVTARVFPEVVREFEGCVPVVTINQLIERIPVREMRSQAVEACRIFFSISAALEDYDPAVARHFRRKFGTFAREIVGAIHARKAFRLLLEAWRPRCVVSSSDMWPPEFQMARQASRIGTPSAVIQHGTVGYHWWPFEATFYVLWGEQFLREMVALGAPPERLLLGGMPASDDLFDKRRSVKDRTANGADAPACLILSQPYDSNLEPGLGEAVRRFLRDLVHSLPHIRWKVKLHPAEDQKFYRNLGEDIYARLDIYPPLTPLDEAILESDVVTTIYSTAGLEAMLLDRPLIVPILSERVRELAWWPQFGGGAYVNTPKEFGQRLNELTSDPQCRSSQLASQNEFLKSCFVNQRHAAEAIVDVLDAHTKSPRQQELALS